MKAEHRKDLQTNVLADSMGKLVKGMKSGSRSATLTIWVFVVLTIATFTGWYIAGGSSAEHSELWVKVEQDSYDRNPIEDQKQILIGFKQIADNNPRTLVGRTARFQRARLSLPLGLEKLYSTERAKAVENLEDARKLYQELLPECSDDALLAQEALMGAAQAEEALVGVPKEDEPGKTYGDLDKALKLYQRLAEKYPGTYLGEKASARAKKLEESRPEVAKFYAELSKLAGPVKK